MLMNSIRIVSVLSALLICFLTGNFQSLHCLWVLPVSWFGVELLLVALAFLFLNIVCKIVDISKPQEHDSPFYRRVLNISAKTAMQLLRTRIHTEGLEKIPTDGRFLLVCNHLDIMDPVLLLWAFPKSQLAFISKKENSDMYLVGKLMHKTLSQLIDRDNDRAALRTILTCIRLIKEDQCSICVFPEGYTSLDGKLHHFRGGSFKIATKANVPIVVCTLQNTQRILRSAAHLHSVHVHLHLLDVITPEQYAGKTAVQISEEVHAMMLEDLGPDFILEEAEAT